MKLLPGTILDYSDLEEYEDITYSDILEWLMDKFYSSDYKSIELDISDDEGLISENDMDIVHLSSTSK